MSDCLLQLWECVVLDLQPDVVLCVLHDVTVPNNPSELAEIYINELQPEHQLALEEGHCFYWHIGYRKDHKGQIRNYSEMCLTPRFQADPGPQRGPASSARIHAQTKSVIRELDSIADHWHARQENAQKQDQENKRLGIHGLGADLVNRFRESKAASVIHDQGATGASWACSMASASEWSQRISNTDTAE